MINSHNTIKKKITKYITMKYQTMQYYVCKNLDRELSTGAVYSVHYMN